jgi:Sel1 repeat-containing protein
MAGLKPFAGGETLEVTLNRRGIFFKKLAAPDIEFFAARTASFANRRLTLTINAPIAEAVLPRAAQRAGYWNVQGRQYPADEVEIFDLNRSVNWQLSGPGTEAAVVRPVAAADWFIVQYEVDPDGKVSFLWRVVTRASQRPFWKSVEKGVVRHLVSGMAHFSENHPEYAVIETLLELDEASDGVDDEPKGVAAGVRSLFGNISLPGFGFPQASIHFGDGMTSPYETRLSPADASVSSAPSSPPFAGELPSLVENRVPTAPTIDAMLNLGKGREPILVDNVSASLAKEMPTLVPRQIVQPLARLPSSSRSRRLGTFSASALGLLVLAALGAKNAAAVSAFACEKFGLHCVDKRQARSEAHTLPAATTVPTDDPSAVTASVPSPAPLAPTTIPKAEDGTEAAASEPHVDEVVWRFLKDTSNSDQLKNFLSQFPTSSYRPVAQIRLAALEPKVTECDLLAAHPWDQQKNPEVTGIKIQFLDTTRATGACERAVADFPDALRFPLQLGRGYEKAKRFSDAHRWYLKAADLGNAQAMHNLGFQYVTGQGAPRDYAEAYKWFDKAAALGNAAAMLRLGELYANGIGVPRDYGEARRWFIQAADRGIPLAMTHLGEIYANGLGVPRDYNEARLWYQKAARLGSAPAMYNLGLLHEQGRGGRHDYAEARKWYAKAADIGNDQAKRSLARLRR